MTAAYPLKRFLPEGIEFNRREFAGAFGDIGTDLPLITGMILVAGLDAASVLIIFGVCQIASALYYKIPMPVQPLKAVAALVIAQGIQANVIAGAGLAIGAVMLLLTMTGMIEWLARMIPKAVIRGLQLGLGIKLGWLALSQYVPADHWPGVVLAILCLGVMAVLRGSHRFPPAIAAIGIGIGYAVWSGLDLGALAAGISLAVPQATAPTLTDVWTGFFVLALPQIPLSLGNSIFATRQLSEDLFPEKKITVRRIGWTYSLNNLLAPLAGGIPVCHGCGGMAGHHAFGGRTGGSVIIYGSVFLIMGLLFSGVFELAVQLFPLPVLGIILLVESTTLVRLVADVRSRALEFSTAIGVGLIAFLVPRGFLVGMIAGTVFLLLANRFTSATHSPTPSEDSLHAET